MRICHIITRLIIGGAQENTILTCEGLHDRGHDVLLLAGPDTGPEGSLWERAEAYGYRTGSIPSMHRAVRPICEWRAVRQLRRALADFKPDVVHTHSSKAGILGRHAAQTLKRQASRHLKGQGAAGFSLRDASSANPAPGIKIVHTIHGMSFNRAQSALVRNFYRRLERLAARHTDRIVTVADAMTEQSVAAGIGPREKFVTVYSGVQTEWFTPDPKKRRAARKQWDVDDDHVVVGTVARLFRNKGYEQLIPALAKVAAENDRLRFVWIGDGADRSRYLDELTRRGIRDRVTLTGLVPPAEVADLVQGFDLLVHCSQWEGLPRSVVQALLLEVPAISFDIDGAPEVVLDGQTGRLVPLNDVPALADAVLQLADDPEIRARMGQAGRQHCLTRFSHHHMVDQLERLYRELLETA